MSDSHTKLHQRPCKSYHLFSSLKVSRKNTIMKPICVSPRYTDWRGEAGNAILLALFIWTIFINLSVGVLTLKVSTKKERFSTYFLIKLFCGNAIVATSQLIIAAHHLYDQMICSSNIVAYVLHQFGMMTGMLSLNLFF